MLAEKTEGALNVPSAQDNRAEAGWLSLFRDGNAPISLMIAGGVAIHALSMRVVSTALPIVVTEIGGLRFFAWTTTVAGHHRHLGRSICCIIGAISGSTRRLSHQLGAVREWQRYLRHLAKYGSFFGRAIVPGFGRWISNRIGLRDDSEGISRESADARYRPYVWHFWHGCILPAPLSEAFSPAGASGAGHSGSTCPSR